MLNEILKKYGVENATIITFGNGLINSTWKVIDGEHEFILQKINNAVFKNPIEIDENIKAIDAYLKVNFPDYYFVSPIITNDNKSIVHTTENEYYRLFEFVKKSVTINVIQTSKQAYEAAKQFGKFTKLLSGFNTDKLNITIPNFHDLTLKYNEFLIALQNYLFYRTPAIFHRPNYCSSYHPRLRDHDWPGSSEAKRLFSASALQNLYTSCQAAR